MWNGEGFSVLGAGSVKISVESEECIKHEVYYTHESGSFQPFLKIDFGEVIEKIEENDFAGGYGKNIKFKNKQGKNV